MKKRIFALFLAFCVTLATASTFATTVSAATSITVTLNKPMAANNPVTKYSFVDAEVSNNDIVTSITFTATKSTTIASVPTTPAASSKLESIDGTTRVYAYSFAAGITAAQSQAFIRGVVFNYVEDAEISVTVDANKTVLPTGAKITKFAHPDGKDHYYIYVSSAGARWSDSYNLAKSYTYMGMTGYLATITSQQEDALLTNISTSGAWTGGTRLRTSASALINDEKTYTLDRTKNVSYFYWACGPEARTIYYYSISAGSTGYNGAYVNWLSGEPNNYSPVGGEECMQVNYPKWNDQNANNTNKDVSGYFVEFSNYTGGMDSSYASDKTAVSLYNLNNGIMDNATVADAKTAAQNASYANMTQAAATDEDAIKAALKNTAETAVSNNGITVTINNVSYTAPVAGTSANPSGTNGSYTFTVTASNGSQSETTEQKTITITATPYTSVTDAEAVAAAKITLVDGIVNVASDADQTAKTAAVQAYVNTLLTGDAAGVTAVVSYNNETGKYEVDITKGSAHDTASLTMTVNAAPDSDAAIVAGAQTAAQNASYADIPQAAATDETAIQAALRSAAEAAVNNSGVTIAINNISYTAPIAGTSANPGGTNGSYTFTVTVSKGGQSGTTGQKTITITAMPNTGVTDTQAVAAAITVLVDGSVNVASGADQTAKTVAVQAYVNALLTGDAAGVTAAVSYNSETGKYEIALSKGSEYASKSLSMMVNESSDPDIAIIDAAKTAAQNASYGNMTQADATNEDAIKAALKSSAETALGNSDISATINRVSYTAPTAGTSANPSGTDGSYIFTVTVSKGSQSETTEQKTVTIKATPYIPPVIIPPTTPTQMPESVGEQITVDVKQGDSDNTISQIIIKRTTDSRGNKSDTLTYNEGQAKETIDKLTKDGKGTARIVIPDQTDEISETTVKIPVKSLALLKEGAINLQIDTEEAKLYIPKESLEKVNESLYGDIYFNLVQVKKEEQKSEIAKRAVVEVVNISGEGSSATVIGVPMVIETNMPSTAMDITLPLTGADLPSNLTEREAFIDQLGIYIEHSDGDKEVIKGELVEFKNGAPGIKFHISKFSTFTIIRSETLKTSTDAVKSTGSDVTKVIVPSKAAITKNKISATVANEKSSLVIKVDASVNASWKLYSDKACTKVLKQNELKLKVGENKAYIKVTAEDGKSSKIYTLTITRKEAPSKLLIIATKYDFADAFAAGVLADQRNGKVVSTGITESDAKKMVAYIKKNYTKQDQIYIIGLGEAVYQDLEKMLKKEGYNSIIHIGGKDKYETAKLVADKVTLSKEAKVVLVNGELKPKDAENIRAVCAELGYPILFVKSGTLTSYTAEALKKIDPTQVYVVGDSSQISSKVVKEITKELGISSKNIIRINTGKAIN